MQQALSVSFPPPEIFPSLALAHLLLSRKIDLIYRINKQLQQQQQQNCSLTSHGPNCIIKAIMADCALTRLACCHCHPKRWTKRKKKIPTWKWISDQRLAAVNRKDSCLFVWTDARSNEHDTYECLHIVRPQKRFSQKCRTKHCHIMRSQLISLYAMSQTMIFKFKFNIAQHTISMSRKSTSSILSEDKWSSQSVNEQNKTKMQMRREKDRRKWESEKLIS